jgi:hypothetical protein
MIGLAFLDIAAGVIIVVGAIYVVLYLYRQINIQIKKIKEESEK